MVNILKGGWGVYRVNRLILGRIHRENTSLTGGMQARVPVTRHKYRCLRYKKILYGYDDFNAYVVVGALRATTNFGRSDVRRHLMTF